MIYLIITLVLIFATAYYFYPSIGGIPSVRTFPFIGAVIAIGKSDLASKIAQWRKEYGDIFQFQMINQNYIVLSHPESLRKVFTSTKVRWTSVDTCLEKVGMLNQGVVNNNDIPSWTKHRQLFKNALATPAFLEYVCQAASENSDLLIQNHLVGNQSVNVANVLKYFTVDTIGLVSFGKSFHALDTDNHEVTDMVVNFLHAFAFYVLNPPLLWKIYAKSERIHAENLIKFNDFLLTMLRQNQKDAALPNPKLKSNFIKELIKQQEAASLADAELLTDMREMIFAGTDTSSNLLTFTFYYLAKYPKYCDMVRNEILSVMPTESDWAEYYKCLSKLPKTTAFLKEVSRMAPVSALILRGVDKDLEVEINKTSYIVPKGSNVILNNEDAGKNDEYMSKPHEFYPERWLTESSAELKLLGRACSVFGYGTRSCPGKEVAWVEMKTLLCKVLPKLRPCLMNENQELNRVYDIVSHVAKNELLLKFEKLD